MGYGGVCIYSPSELVLILINTCVEAVLLVTLLHSPHHPISPAPPGSL